MIVFDPTNWKSAPFLERWLARLLGERVSARDGNYRTIGYRWRGRIYIWHCGEC